MLAGSLFSANVLVRCLFSVEMGGMDSLSLGSFTGKWESMGFKLCRVGSAEV